MSDTVVAAGQFTVTLIHPLWNGGTPTAIAGFRMEGQMVQTQQLKNKKKIIALANGDTITITNNNDAGTLTFNVVKTSDAGDMVKIANYLRRVGDSVGGVISISQEVNGVSQTTTFNVCTVKSVPPLNIQGNDASDYQVVWNYANSSNDDDTESEG
mgnify:FL=1